MQFKSGTHRTEVTRYIKVIDGPVLPVAYSTAERRFRVERIKIAYVLDDYYQWNAGWAIDVSGTVLKKDGTDSKNDHTSTVFASTIREAPEKWDWLIDLINAARPLDAPSLPSLEA